MTVTNTGTVPCEVNVGTSQMEFAISSGADRIFSSVDCQEGGEDLMKLLEPGGSEVANFPWDGLRSAPGCTDAAPELQPKPGWYAFTAKLGEVSSDKAVFELQ